MAAQTNRLKCLSHLFAEQMLEMAEKKGLSLGGMILQMKFAFSTQTRLTKRQSKYGK